MKKILSKKMYRAFALLLAFTVAVTCGSVPVMADSGEAADDGCGPVSDTQSSEALKEMAEQSKIFNEETDLHIEESRAAAEAEASGNDAADVYAGENGSAVSISDGENNEGDEVSEEDQAAPGAEEEAGESVPDGYTAVYDRATLESVKKDPAGQYFMTADIDLGGEEWAPIADLTGVFDGNGHKISGLRVTDTENGRNGGLFDVIEGSVKNLTISGAVVGALDADNNFIDMTDDEKTSGYLRVAALAAILDEDASAENCVVKNSKIYGTSAVGALIGVSKGSVNGCDVTGCDIYGIYPGKNGGGYSNENFFPTCVGGFAGTVVSGTVKNCSVETVKINSWLSNAGWITGGFAGQVGAQKAVIDSCVVDKTNVNGYQLVGGFAGMLLHATIRNSSSNASVYGFEEAGGFLGQSGGTDFISDKNDAITENCSATGNVNAVTKGGGFVGAAVNSVTYDSYATGNVKVTGTFSSWNLGPAGGFAGLANGKAGFIRCYATGDVSAPKGAGGFVGNSMLRYLQTSVLDCPSRDYPHQAAEYGGYAECYATGNVTTTDKFGISAAGGFAGQLQDNSVPADCYATGNVSGYKNVGGFVGSVYDCGALNCYYSGQISCDTDTAGGFVGYVSRGDVRTVCFTNCVFDKDATGTENAIGQKYKNLYKEWTDYIKGGEEEWPAVNPPVETITGVSSDELKSAATYETLDQKYCYVSYLDKKYYEISDKWDLADTWTVDGNTSPYLKNLGDGQAASLKADKMTISADSEATVRLTGYAGENCDIAWSVSGSGIMTASDADSVKVKADGDGIISVSVIINGVKQKTLNIIAGTGGIDGMTVNFLTPAPSTSDEMSAYCVDVDSALKVRFSEPVDADAFAALKDAVKLTEKRVEAGAEKKADVSASLSENNCVLMIKPAEVLNYGAEYTLSLSSNIKAASGKNLVGVNAMSFTTASFDVPAVSVSAADGAINVSAEYTDNIKHYNSDGDEYTATDSATVYIVARAGKGARADLGGDVIASVKKSLSIESGKTDSVIEALNIPDGVSGNIYIDVYTWDADTGMVIAPAVVKSIKA